MAADKDGNHDNITRATTMTLWKLRIMSRNRIQLFSLVAKRALLSLSPNFLMTYGLLALWYNAVPDAAHGLLDARDWVVLVAVEPGNEEREIGSKLLSC